MDWEPLVRHLAQSKPALVVDSAQQIQFANAGMLELLGWSFGELSARSLVDLLVPDDDRAAAKRLLDAGLNGTERVGDIAIVTRGARRWTMRVSLSPESQGRGRSVVLVVTELREVDDDREGVPCDCSFDVSRAPRELGVVKSVRFLEPSRAGDAHVGRPLGEILAAIGCSAAEEALRAALEKPTNEIVEALLPPGDRVFRVIEAHPVEGSAVRVTVRCLDSQLLPELVDAKVARVADTNGLSDRERQVLRLLLRGRGVEDIATMLEIAPRTVKFHQANVLQKLGADSRIDLLRVVL